MDRDQHLRESHNASHQALERLDQSGGGKAEKYDANNNANDRLLNQQQQQQRQQQQFLVGATAARGQESGASLLTNREQVGGDCPETESASGSVGGAQASASCLSSGQSESNLSVSTADDWHLLDVDERSSSASSSSNSSLASSDCCESCATPARSLTKSSIGRSREAETRISRQRESLAAGSRAKNKSKMGKPRGMGGKPFIVVDPRDTREKLNKSLVYLCTGLYSLMPLASLVAFVTLVCLLFTKLWFVTVIYYSYLLLDSKTCNRGGRRLEFVYRSSFWSHLAAYFPIRLRYSQDFKLSDSENYILNYHPHGISAFGCVATFATNGLGFSELFPGISSRFMVHETSFLVPVMRETFGLRGDCSVNSASFDYILSQKWMYETKSGKKSRSVAADAVGARNQDEQVNKHSGNLLALCGGGLAEADLSDMETLKIVCATRKGFVKKALIHGAHLVPCIAFGENSVFKKVNLKPGSLLQRIEAKWYQLFKFKHPIYYGTNFLGGSKLAGVMPYKRPITVCMGDPIQVQRVEQPTQEQIDELHLRYMKSLKSMYEDNGDLCEEFDQKLELL